MGNFTTLQLERIRRRVCEAIDLFDLPILPRDKGFELVGVDAAHRPATVGPEAAINEALCNVQYVLTQPRSTDDGMAPMTQRRPPQQGALITRDALINSAATEFAQHGYGDGSVNQVLREAGTIKGALYFQFPSKLALAEAVLHEADAIYNAIGERWRADRGVGVNPVDAITFMVRDAAHVYDHDMVVWAEARLTLEPNFANHSPLDTWQSAVADLARRAAETNGLREGFTADKFARVLTTTLAGQCYMVQVVQIGEPELIRGRYDESPDVIFAAAGIDGVAPHHHA